MSASDRLSALESRLEHTKKQVAVVDELTRRAGTESDALARTAYTLAASHVNQLDAYNSSQYIGRLHDELMYPDGNKPVSDEDIPF